MILVALASVVFLPVSDPVDAARPAERAYFACLVEAAKQVDSRIPGDIKAVAATIEADCQDEAWAYLIALKLASPDKSNVDPRVSGIVRDETYRAIRTERRLPRNSN